MMTPDFGRSLLPLLDYLATAGDALPEQWQAWRLARVGGGGNNLLYRATRGRHDLAIKFTIRDSRDRAGREYHALLAIQQAGLSIAAAPLWLERERYAQPVVVQSWLAGEIHAAPPAGDAEWQRLLEHYLAIASVTPARAGVPLAAAVLNMRSAAGGLHEIRQQLAYIPEDDRPAALSKLVDHVERMPLPEWSAPDLALCRVDPNTLNFVRRAGAWASVDWENSGWGDPAYEIADLITHPSYAGVPDARWGWLVEAYCEGRGEPGAATRIRVYRLLMLVWWAARLARMLYEVPRGGDQRLSGRPAGWMDAARSNYARYLELAQAAAL
jgi:hypothetical protein